VPLVAAGLMLRTFTNLLQAPIGFDSAHVITARIPLNLQAFSTVDRRSAFYRDANRARARAAGRRSRECRGPPPFAPAQVTQRYSRSDDPDAAPSMGLQQSVMPGYFDVMRIPLRAGRDISDDDILHRRRVAVVDERLAAQLWLGDAVGQHLTVGQMAPLEVIGVAARIRARAVRDSDTPMVYVPAHIYEIEQTLLVKTRVPLSSIGRRSNEPSMRSAPGGPSPTSGRWTVFSRHQSTTRDSPC
jgi:putative ABC transport system permease protein